MLLGSVLQIIDKYICDHHPQNLHRDCARELFDLFHAKGVQIITDDDRRAAGLPPRDENGMTMEELAILEENMLAAMRRPIFTWPADAKP